jgi:lipoyl-dependent peroxiredoxin
MKTLYTAEAVTTGGRAGHSRSSDGNLEVELAPPVEMGGSGAGTNPEELFAAGYSACFQSAMSVVGRRMKVDTGDSTVTARVSLVSNKDRGFDLEVELEVAIPGVERPTAEELIAKADRVCPYSNAVRGNIPVKLTVV